MKKIKMFVIAVIAMMIPAVLVHAEAVDCDTNHVAEMDGKCYATIQDAISEITDTTEKTIDVVDDVTLTAPVNVLNTNNVVLNLKGVTISRDDYLFNVGNNASLKITGTGEVKNIVEHYITGAFSTNTIYVQNNAKLVIDENVKVSGYDVITLLNCSNEVTVDIYGTIVTRKDADPDYYTDGLPTLGGGIYVNKGTGVPTINIHDGALITGEGVGLYLAGPNKTTVGKATIEGATGIAIKAGEVTLNGSTVRGTYEYADANPWNEGVMTTGAAIQVESNTSEYAGQVKIHINDGTYTSEHGYAFQEYVADGSDTVVEDIDFNAGTFESNADDGKALNLSEEFNNKYEEKPFIDAGTVFTSNGEAATDVLDFTNDLDISESGVVGKIYDINVKVKGTGKVTVNNNAAVGEEVTLTVTSGEGYELDTLVIIDANGKEIVVKDNKFIMPESDVIIAATFKKVSTSEVVEEEEETEEEAPETLDAGLTYVGLAVLSLGATIISVRKLRNN